MKSSTDESTQDSNPSFVGSSPLGADLLEGQSQERIAESVSHLIRTGRTENRLIGLDGVWGSGKTNLVKIIASKLRDTHHAFFYDAWGHQEDLQRRAFLEELTADLCTNEIVDPDVWKLKLKDLLSRKRETVTKTIPRLGYGVAVTLLIAIFTPVASTIADGSDDPLTKIAITSTPLLIGLALWIIASVRAAHMLSIHEVYALYKEKDLSNETHVTISEKEPSVGEFQRWMKELSHALDARNLVIVFDNMDRLPPDRVRELWSSIHTFFAEESFEGIWVIIPFDRDHIAAAFDDDKEISDQFLRKSFSVIYRVAPPVLTDWQKFFEKKYKEAFRDWEDKELYIVKRAFDLLESHITPRSIIAFINEIVSLRLIVEEEILLRYIAIFVLTKEAILAAPVDQILSLEFLRNAAPLFRDDEDLPNHIAALVYQVPLASASQVSLTREIQNSLQDRNESRLNELAKHKYFIDILEQVIAGGELDIPNAAATLAMLEDRHTSEEEVSERLTKIWDDLCDRGLQSPPSKQELTGTHKLLLEHSSQRGRQALAGHIVVGVRNAEEFDGAAYFEALSELSDYVDQQKLDIDVQSLVTDIKKSPEIFVDYVAAAGKDYRTFKLSCDGSELTEFIEQRIPDGLEGLDALAVVKKDYSFERIIKKLEAELPSNTLTAETVAPFYRFYKAISTEKPIRPVEDGHIVNLLKNVQDGSEAQFELLAMRLAKGKDFPNVAGPTQAIVVEKDEKKAERIAKNIEYYATYNRLLLTFVSWQPPMLKLVLRLITLNAYGASRLSIIDVLPHFVTLYQSLDVAPEDFIKRLNAWAQHAKKEITEENVAEIVTGQEFFEYAIKVNCDLCNHIISKMVERLNSLKVEEWKSALRDEASYLFNVTYWLLYGGQLNTVPENAVTVYKDILIEVAKGEFVTEAMEAWDMFYERTHKSKLKATAKNIRDLFISECAITPERFLKLADLLLRHADLKEKNADVSRRILAPIANDESCLAFIIENRDFFATLVNDAGDDAGDFKDIVRQKTTSPDAIAELTTFAKAIGIEAANGVVREEAEEEDKAD